MFNAFEKSLKEHHRPYILLKGDKENRFKKATEAIDEILAKKEIGSFFGPKFFVAKNFFGSNKNVWAKSCGSKNRLGQIKNFVPENLAKTRVKKI